MKQVCKLLFGNDKRNPIREVDLTDQSDAGILLPLEFAAPTPGQKDILWSGRSTRFDGEQRLRSSRGNIRLNLKYNLQGNPAEMTAWYHKMSQYVNDVRLFRENGYGDKVWLEYGWSDSDNLDSLPRPVWGQQWYYLEVLDIEFIGWPSSLHSGLLAQGFIEGAGLAIVGAPYWEGLEQTLLNANNTLDKTANNTTTLREIDKQVNVNGASIAFCGWFQSRDITGSDYQVFGIGTHAVGDYLSFQMPVAATNNWQAVGSVDGNAISISQNFADSSVSNGDLTHVGFTYDGNTATLYINGASVGEDTSGTSNLFTTSACVWMKDYNRDLASWRIWNTILTSSQVEAIYNAELTNISSSLAKSTPYFYTSSGSGAIDAVNGTISSVNKNNWGIVGELHGDAPAKARYEFAPGDVAVWDGLYISNKTTTASFDPDDIYFLDFDGTAESGKSSNDAYFTASGVGFYEAKAVTTASILPGEYTALVTFRHGVSGSVWSIYPYYQIGIGQGIVLGQRANIYRTGDTTVDTGEHFLYELGDIRIDHPHFHYPQASVSASVGLKGFLSESSISDILPHLVSSWTLDAANWEDQMNLNDLSSSGAAVNATAKLGSNSASFTGAQYLWRAASDLRFIPTRSFTVNAWVRTADNAADQGILGVIDNSTNKDGLDIYYNVGIPQTGWAAGLHFGSDQRVTTGYGVTPTNNTWYMLTVRYDAQTGWLKISQNGSLSTSGSTYVGSDLPWFAGADLDLVIGSIRRSGTNGWKGLIDNVQWFDVSLTDAQMTTLYNSGNGKAFTEGEFEFDFIQILPKPVCKVLRRNRAELATGDYMVIDGHRAYQFDSSASAPFGPLDFYGDEVGLVPKKYNLITVLQGRNRGWYQAGKTGVMTIKHTPRFTLPGGLIT